MDVINILGSLSTLCKDCGYNERFELFKIDGDEYLGMIHEYNCTPFGYIRVNGTSAIYAAIAALRAIMEGGADNNYISEHGMYMLYGADWKERLNKW